MSTVSEVLENLAENGISVELDHGSDLLLKPSVRVTDDVVSEISAVKPAVVRALRLREVGAAERDDPTNWLLERLRSGVDWLNSTATKLDELPNAGLGAITTTGNGTNIPSTRLNDQFIQGFDRWYVIEDCLRDVLDYDKCVLGVSGPCAEASVVRCRLCANR